MNEAEFELWQDDMCVAGASGEREQALSEMRHYAMVYGQDGPVQVFQVLRMAVDPQTGAPLTGDAQP